jgi:hypothetical protein
MYFITFFGCFCVSFQGLKGVKSQLIIRENEDITLCEYRFWLHVCVQLPLLRNREKDFLAHKFMTLYLRAEDKRAASTGVDMTLI